MNSSVRRSWLIVPAHDTEKLEQAAHSGADVVALDLEDTVHDGRKREARDNIREAISVMRDSGSEVFVRDATPNCSTPTLPPLHGVA